MCVADQSGPISVPSGVADAMAMVRTGLASLAAADPTELPAAVQAECLRFLERAESMQTAARASVLAAFTNHGGYEDDGQGSERSWLQWQTRITRAAAAGAVGWMRRLRDHPAVADALKVAQISSSWARLICDWSDQLPEAARADADLILLAAAAGGAGLADLAGLAEEMRRRTARPDQDGEDDGFADRSVRLLLHYRGAGKLDGELTPQCAAALQAVLDCLGKKAGPEDIRTRMQRHHDALEEACRRLLASGCLPDRAGQPAQIQLHMTLDQLTGGPGSGPGRSGPGSSGAGGSGPGGAGFGARLGAGTGHGGAGTGWAGPGPAAGPGGDCDAMIIPVVTGHVDPVILDRLAAMLLRWRDCPDHNGTGRRSGTTGPAGRGNGSADSGIGIGRTSSADAPGGTARPASAGGAVVPGTRYARELVLRDAIALLSGPAGLAAWLRTSQLTGPAASISLPLDIGTATDTIPPHLRRAVITRDRHCAFPSGCDQPPAACQVHHIIPRSEGGPTRLTNLGLLCTFHHLIFIHRWGWILILNADGSYTATSPDGTRTLRSHSPPATAALPGAGASV